MTSAGRAALRLAFRGVTVALAIARHSTELTLGQESTRIQNAMRRASGLHGGYTWSHQRMARKSEAEAPDTTAPAVMLVSAGEVS